MEQSFSSSRPYLLRAIHEWITDNGETPLVLVDATHIDTQVPAEHIKDGRITLNIAWSATRNLEMTNEYICFDARFNGAARAVSFPINALLGIYARESGHGMGFEVEASVADTSDEVISESTTDNSSSEVDTDQPAVNDDTDAPRPRPNGPGLRLVK
ncbi:MAG: ClpXP protease specificity-enhancing factor [Gammaproteobacteria bacterium]|nr:ClpXP protease specificity-enhancing factor [Gammaproteobacteria bacterium]MCP4088591.1 ClpXP protease specificity-enhancing factor [Gammaproteobacteria bacterium]MCP4276501.1 ClpXP protease specificity-enhancing factor [Gammaproteobacteria bacterium]MCP4832378.1 ClpXP protease specificity-enhancing factor [Gammaproteobacteria bacterium]MCP4929108.1 ClpXP protease specificity-enhancing factor [Gammaproteobacteria bacterium]